MENGRARSVSTSAATLLILVQSNTVPTTAFVSTLWTLLNPSARVNMDFLGINARSERKASPWFSSFGYVIQNSICSKFIKGICFVVVVSTAMVCVYNAVAKKKGRVYALDKRNFVSEDQNDR